MKIIRLIARFLCSAAILIGGFYTAIAVAVAFFIVTGTLTPGSVMFDDSLTPTLSQTLLFIGAGLIAVAGFAFARHRLFAREAR